MSSFSTSSRKRLETCHPDLQRLFTEVVKNYDCAVLCGHRTEAEQNFAFKTGVSKAAWPLSRHNTTPSEAIDVMPYPIDWKDLNRLYHFAGYVLATAHRLGIEIRWGMAWNGDFKFNTKGMLMDGPHWELVIPTKE